MFGHWGRILTADLSSGEIRKQTFSKQFAREYLGGNGFAARLIADRVPADVDPFDAANAIVFAVGPLTHTPVWGSSRGHVAAISPQTGLFADSNFGGNFPAAQKRAGFDAVFITGEADKPVYLLITEDGGQIKDAGDVWGRTTEEANTALQEAEGKGAVAASIGPAGENGVLFAAIVGAGVRHGVAGRCGMGAVMGAKRLKAIVAMGRKKTQVARPDKLKAFLAERTELLTTSTAPLHDFGTPVLVKMINDRGLLCTHNATTEVCSFADRIGAEVLSRKYVERSAACYGCRVACGKIVSVPRGEFAGRSIKMPEYESIYAVGAMLDVADMDAIINANGLCDQYGMDTVSMGVTLSFVAECLEKGLITETDIGGNVRFGDGDGLVELVKATALRRGIGELLALGSCRLAERFGPESRKLLYAVRGLEIPGHSARGLRSMGVGYATSTRGGSHHDVRPKYLVPESDPGFAGQAEHSVRTQNLSAVGDSLVMCRFIHERVLGSVITPDAAELVSLVTGWDMDADELERIGERVYNLERLINVKRGTGRKDDCAPYRAMNEPIPEGPAKGRICRREDLDAMLDEYYEFRGWSRRGIPGEEKLRELGLQ